MLPGRGYWRYGPDTFRSILMHVDVSPKLFLISLYGTETRDSRQAFIEIGEKYVYI